MNSKILLLAIALVVTGCATTPPPPPSCGDDESALQPVNQAGHTSTSEKGLTEQEADTNE